jgi:hypothetical protein
VRYSRARKEDAAVTFEVGHEPAVPVEASRIDAMLLGDIVELDRPHRARMGRARPNVRRRYG